MAAVIWVRRRGVTRTSVTVGSQPAAWAVWMPSSLKGSFVTPKYRLAAFPGV